MNSLGEILDTFPSFFGPGVYAIELDGGTYIGQSDDLMSRFTTHYVTAERGKHQSPKFQQAWGGDVRLLVLERVGGETARLFAEKQWMRRYMSEGRPLLNDRLPSDGTPIDDWMAACGLPTDSAAAVTLGVHRHTIAAMRTRELTKVEGLAMASVLHKLGTWQGI